jgi:hemolysin activation/secretion protein
VGGRPVLFNPCCVRLGNGPSTEQKIVHIGPGRGLAVLLLWSFLINPTWAVGGGEYMERPSERPLSRPEFSPRTSPENFTLPLVPEDASSTGQEANQHKLFIKRIVVVGNTVFPDRDLRSIVQPFEGRAVTVAELENLRQMLSKRFVEHGYVNSGAIIPSNAYTGGELRIQIIEGHLDEIRVKGQERLREAYVANRLQGDREKPLNIQELQDRFQVLLSDPLISRMNGRLLPGAVLGHSILDVDVKRARPYHLTLFADNHRPPSIGAEGFGVSAWVRNITGLGDALDFTFINSDGSTRYAGGLSLPLNDWGTLANFRFDQGDATVVEAPVDKLSIESRVHNLEGGLSHIIINTLNRRLNFGIALAIRENETTLLGRPFSFVPGESTGRTQATVWRVSQDFLQRWEDQAFEFRSTFSVGMDALGATSKTSDDFPSSEFFVWLGQAQYAYRLLNNGSQFVLRSNAQFSNARLLPLEQMAVGGVGTVRGYRENHLVRDNGYNVSLEFHYPVINGDGPNAKHRITLIPFMDYGRAWNYGGNAKGQQISLHSIGIGLNWQLSPVSLDLYYGYALIRAQPHTAGDLQDDGIHFQVRVDAL